VYDYDDFEAETGTSTSARKLAHLKKTKTRVEGMTATTPGEMLSFKVIVLRGFKEKMNC
jgi:hypothetical protein